MTVSGTFISQDRVRKIGFFSDDFMDGKYVNVLFSHTLASFSSDLINQGSIKTIFSICGRV